MTAFVWWRADLRHFIALFNIVVILGIAGYLLWATFSKRKLDEKAPPNRVAFFEDDTLEGRRLERVLGWALIFVTAFAIVFLVYLLREPVRQEHSEAYFDNASEERGEELFANSQMDAYNPVKSLSCADCHGQTGAGGGKAVILDPDGPNGPEPPQAHVWKVPPLNTVLLRFQEDPECADPALKPRFVCEVSQIITYGRPGTPMPAFGVAGGGAKNDQAINDIIAYLRTIQLSSDDAKKQASDQLEEARGQAAAQVEDAQTAVDDANKALDDARAAAVEQLGVPATTTDDALLSDCNDLEETAKADPSKVTPEMQEQAKACRDFKAAVEARDTADANLAWSHEWEARRANTTDGQYLFELFCARCHTEGWSVFDSATPEGVENLGLAGGGGGQGGGIGFNLRDGGTERRFGPGDIGTRSMLDFVSLGSSPFVGYGKSGIGSGRMPGFAKMLTADQICLIVEYERNGLQGTTYGPEAKGAEPLGANECQLPPETTTTSTAGTTTTTTGR
ncbi:MAG TPA: c-type cytochrome [Acidimicrobiia bacterium]|nr:c-type cytochrome [Acidimicrobiia bacterium]